MVNNNVYKPRYKIAFQAKSKIWPYKNSRLRRFFNIRGRKLVRRGLFKRYFLVFNNMKWTIARRYIRPYMQKRRALRRKYRNVFYSKQQLRAFYGIQKEEIFRNFFKKFLSGAKGRNNMFAIALERRADMVLFRLRFLPTIYACNQFVHHFGLNINGKKEYSANALIIPGDIITFEKAQWSPFVEYLFERLYWRVYGLNVWKRRQFKALRKKIWWCSKNKFFRKSNVILLKKIYYTTRRLLRINVTFANYLPVLYKEIRTVEILNRQNTANPYNNLRKNMLFFWQNYRKTMKVLIKKIMITARNKWKIKMWNWKQYYVQYFNSITLLFRLYKTLTFYFAQFKMLELSFYKTLINTNTKVDWHRDNSIFKELKGLSESTIQNQQQQHQVLLKKQNFLKKINIRFKNKINFLKQRIKYFFWLKILNKKYALFEKKSVLSLRALMLRKLLFFKRKQNLVQQEIFSIQRKINVVETENLSLFKQKNAHFKTLIKKIKTKINLKKKMNNILSTRAALMESKLVLFQHKINFLINFILKRRIKRYSLKSKLSTRKGSAQILYFLTRRRMKKTKKFALPRLKKVHWFVPNYIYVDYRTLRAVYLYNPRPEEIVYSFKCSLRAIHAFYRSRGL